MQVTVRHTCRLGYWNFQCCTLVQQHVIAHLINLMSVLLQSPHQFNALAKTFGAVRLMVSDNTRMIINCILHETTNFAHFTLTTFIKKS